MMTDEQFNAIMEQLSRIIRLLELQAGVQKSSVIANDGVSHYTMVSHGQEVHLTGDVDLARWLAKQPTGDKMPIIDADAMGRQSPRPIELEPPKPRQNAGAYEYFGTT